jgi:hypothetical protein
MALGRHERAQLGRFRAQRADSFAKDLRKQHPGFDKVHGGTNLGTVTKQFGENSLGGVRQASRRKA